MPNPPKVIDTAYFASRSKKNDATGCIEWTRHISDTGYGTLKYKQKQWTAHRFFWQFQNGKIPHGMIVCHKCDNRKCINPEHLFLGTTQDNVTDKMNKGRFVASIGERSGLSKLTELQVRQILEDTRPQTKIAKDFGISQSNVSIIKCRVTWRHVA